MYMENFLLVVKMNLLLSMLIFHDRSLSYQFQFFRILQLKKVESYNAT